MPPMILVSPSNPQPVRLRRQLHYSEHDVLLNAQPYINEEPSYPLIRFPGPDNDTAIYWAMPTEEDFEVMAGHNLSSVPLGTLSLSFVSQLHTIFLDLFVNNLSQLFVSDIRVKCMRQRLRYLFEQLSTPGMFSQALMIWRLAQRLVLLLEAEIMWIISVKPTFTTPDAWKCHHLRNVLLTDFFALAFLSGSFVRLHLEPTAKVIEWFKSDSVPLRLPSNYISFKDNTPVRPTVYDSAAQAAYDRYRRMVLETWSIAFPAVILAQRLSPLPLEVHTWQRHSPMLLARRRPHLWQDHRELLLASYINLFALKDASKNVSKKFSLDMLPCPGVNRGYILPEPAVLAGHENEFSRTQYFRTYVKLRPLLLYSLRMVGPLLCQKKAANWRIYLGLEVHGGERSDTCTAAARAEVCNQLNEIAQRMGNGFSVNSLGDLESITASWNGREYTGALPDNVQREVLNEIFNISFRYEVLLLDRYLYKLLPSSEEGEILDEYDTCTREQCNVVIEAALFSNGPSSTFSSRDPAVRQAALYSFFRIMRGWTAPTPMVQETVEDGQGLAPGHACSAGDLDSIKYYLAYFYIFSFAECFHRAPLLPHYI
ncbi:hypothetical protein BDP27DRAFT_1424702 [Rhodocollybia butyracea]|uniref:Uncharacterized protein n=1 Tax=Rhodocollybia butyracea TaxID=206335 RepID=A0A9P5PHT2_9AGAR|nr:hypothetical protein BDP27DRAFT_1424702 [Rhodocollybia butyracea]